MSARVSILAILLFAFSANAEESITVDLKGIDDGRRDYSQQLIARFWEIVKVNDTLKKEFDAYSQLARERSGGKYMGPEVQPLVLKRSEDVNFRDSGGWRKYNQTIVLYCSFAEGYRKGMQIETGVFAVFEVKGHQTYDRNEGNGFKLKEHKVTALFKGFQTTLTAQPNGAGQPAPRKSK